MDDDSHVRVEKVEKAVRVLRKVHDALSPERWAKLTEQQLMLLCMQSTHTDINPAFIDKMVREVSGNDEKSNRDRRN